jgi:hypothetical protein
MKLGPVTVLRKDFASDPRIFANLNGGHWKRRTAGPTLPPGYVSRVWGIESDTQWRHLRSLGFNILATDHVRAKWASVSPRGPYALNP